MPVRVRPVRTKKLTTVRAAGARFQQCSHEDDGAANAPIRVRAAAESDTFELSVSNAGDPIPPAALERLFQPFTRGAVRPTQQGLGLGLYIASEIARAHGGTLKVCDTDHIRIHRNNVARST